VIWDSVNKVINEMVVAIRANKAAVLNTPKEFKIHITEVITLCQSCGWSKINSFTHGFTISIYSFKSIKCNL
jgi:hypothetical protein